MSKLSGQPRNKKPYLGGCLVLWLLFMGSIAPSWAATRVAVVGPFSGAYQAHGERQLAGARWAVSQLAVDPGLEIWPLDDQCDARLAEERAREVVAAGVTWVVGHLCSAASFAAAPIYEAAGVVMISPASTDPALTRQGYQRVFRILPTPDAQVSSAVGFLQQRLMPERLAVIHDDQVYGELVGRSLINRLQEVQMPVVLTATTTRGQRDFSRLVEVLAGNHVDAIYYAGFAEELGLFLSQARQGGLHVPVMGPDALVSRRLRELAGAAADGVYLTLPAALAAPTETELERFIVSQGWEHSELMVLATVAAMQVIAGALELAVESETGAPELRGSVYATSLGILGFDAMGEPSGFPYGVFRWEGDKIVAENR